MTITWGLVLQAIGIFLEGVGLIMAFRSFGTADDRKYREGRSRYDLPPDPEVYEIEGRKFTCQLWIIGAGLTLQLVGLFVP